MRLSPLAQRIVAQLLRQPSTVEDLAILVFPLRRGGGWTASRRRLAVGRCLGRMLAAGYVEQVKVPPTWQLTEAAVTLLGPRR